MPDSQPGPARPARHPDRHPERHEVLITRASGLAAPTAERVRQLGFEPVLAPLFLVRARPIGWPARCDAVLVTSGNAVASLHDAPPCPVLAVGDGTAARLRDAGLQRVVSARGDAAALLDLARRSLAPGAVLVLATGTGQGADLTGDLRQAGFRVYRRVAYATRPARRLPEAAAASITGNRLHAILFLSAETARIFHQLLPARLRPALAGIEALAIAPGVAAALAPLPWRRVRVSVAPTLDQVLALL